MNTIITNIGDFNLPTKIYGDASFSIIDPSSNSPALFSYTSSNISVANVTGQNITITGAGNCTITAIQPEFSNQPGLQYTVYTGYFNDNVNYFTNAAILRSGTVTGIPSIHLGTAGYIGSNGSNENYSVQWLGYFKPDISGTWTFWINSDDSSLLWLGTYAESNFSLNNTLINNGGLHGMIEKTATVALNANTFYPIRIQYGEQYQGDNMILNFQGPAGSAASPRTTDGRGFFYTNKYTSATKQTTLTVEKNNPILTNFPDIYKSNYDIQYNIQYNFTLLDPSSNSNGSFSYSSSNTDVATVSKNVVTILKVGSSNITATQDACGNYTSRSITSTLVSDICFPAGTPISTDQGIIDIEKIDPVIHTIRKKTIIGITKTISIDDFLVCFERHSLGNNIPSQRTKMTQHHEIFYNGKMIKAIEFINHYENVYKVEYTGETLYNVLLEKHDKMVVNNLICETLDPTNPIAKLYRYFQQYTLEEQDILTKEYNKYVINYNKFTKKQLKKLNKCV